MSIGSGKRAAIPGNENSFGPVEGPPGLETSKKNDIAVSAIGRKSLGKMPGVENPSPEERNQILVRIKAAVLELRPGCFDPQTGPSPDYPHNSDYRFPTEGPTSPGHLFLSNPPFLVCTENSMVLWNCSR